MDGAESTSFNSGPEGDAEHFYGREAEVEAMWRKLERPHLLALIGPSGAGKSSFLRAGLVPALPEGWRHILCQPGDKPFLSLARALAPGISGDADAVAELAGIEDLDTAVALVSRWRKRHMEALLIVDQFEELFTLNRPDVQSRFAELLGRLAIEADVRVLLSMRDDFLFYCHDHQSLSPILSEMTLLGPPKGDALRRALVQPALGCGYRFEDESLVDEMLAEVSGERGTLPLLAFAASRLWELRDREQGFLTRAAYEKVGGVGGALAHHAEKTMERIGPARERIVREILRNLVTAQATRAVRDREELLSVFESREEAGEVLQKLIDARLLTSFEIAGTNEEESHHRIEIIHESLLTAWPRLVRWQTQDSDNAQLRDQLRQAARLWEERDRSQDLLWTGTAFQEFQLWRERYPGGLTEVEEAFGKAMVAKAEHQKKRRRRVVTTVVATLLLGLILMGTLWQRAEQSRRVAEAETRRAEAGKLLALGQIELDDYPTAAVAYAIASLELADTPEARLFALGALERGPIARIMSWPQPMEAETFAMRIAFSPDGEWFALAGFGGNGRLLSADGQENE